MNIPIIYKNQSFNIKITDKTQLGDILENTLNQYRLMIHEIYGISFEDDNNKNVFLGNDDLPFHFSWSRFLQDYSTPSGFYLLGKDDKPPDSFSKTLTQRYIMFLSAKEDELIAKKFEMESYDDNYPSHAPSPMQIFNPNFFINMGNSSQSNPFNFVRFMPNENHPPPPEPENTNVENDTDNENISQNEQAEDDDNDDMPPLVPVDPVSPIPSSLPNTNHNLFNNIMNASSQNIFNILTQSTSNNNVESEVNENTADIERIFNISNTNTMNNYHTPSHNLGLMMENIQNIITNAFNDQVNNPDNMEDVAIVLSKEHINTLPTGKYGDLCKNYKIDSTQCGITLEEFTDETEITVLPCNHGYTTEAIEKWLTENSNKCPICRAEVMEGHAAM